jgi:hypothetical protein
MKHTTMAEINQLSRTTEDVMAIINTLEAMQIPITKPVTIYCDSTGANFIAENSTLSQKTKYFLIDELYVRQEIKAGNIRVQYIESLQNPADPMTKPKSEARIKAWCDQMYIIVGEGVAE